MRRLPSWVLLAVLTAGAASYLGAQTGTPTPESVIGFVPCDDYKLATYEQIASYFQTLDEATDRMALVEIGETAGGRTQLMAIISSEANLQQLDRFKTISRRLAGARGLTDTEARQLAAQGRAVVWIDFGLHSTEVGHAQTAPLMAYRAVTDESNEMRAIRDNVIFLLVPNMNPDGTTLVADWYMQHVGTRYERTSPPELYQKYAGHDNNRDWFMFNLRESRNVARQLYGEWLPQIVYNQHQSAPFPARIFVPPFDDPMNPNIPPLVMHGINLVGEAMTRRLDQEGKTGAISRLNYDTWWNGGMRTAPYYHNMVGILTETGHASATPSVYDPETFPETFADGRPTLEPTTYYPSPYRGGEWHLRDTCEYMLTASMAILDIGAKRRAEWLYDSYQMGRDAIEAGRGQVYVVSADQWDPGTAIKLVNVLRWGGVEIARAPRQLTIGERTYPANSFVIHGAQPFRPYVTDLLNPQVYPDQRLYPGGPPDQPYDITGWTLPLQMGVAVDRHDGVGRLPTDALVEVAWAEPDASTVPVSAGGGFAIDSRANDAFIAVNRLLAGGEVVQRATDAVSVGGTIWPAGTFLVPTSAGARARVEAAVRGLGLKVGALDDGTPPPDAMHLGQPRVALYHGWGGNADEGWTRFVLEQFEFPYERLHDADVQADGLGAYDVIVLPDASYNRMLTGLSSPQAPPEYTGGMTPTGVSNLYEFVERGGTLVALDSATELPLVDFGLPLRDVTTGRQTSEFYVPGTLLEIVVDPTHPVAYGMPARAAAFFARSPAFAVEGSTDDAEAGDASGDFRVVARYPDTGLLQSGWVLGEQVLAGRAAVVEARVGQGRVVLVGFRTQHRGQPHGTFKLLFNALYLAAATSGPGETRREPGGGT